MSKPGNLSRDWGLDRGDGFLGWKPVGRPGVLLRPGEGVAVDIQAPRYCCLHAFSKVRASRYVQALEEGGEACSRGICPSRSLVWTFSPP